MFDKQTSRNKKYQTLAQLCAMGQIQELIFWANKNNNKQSYQNQKKKPDYKKKLNKRQMKHYFKFQEKYDANNAVYQVKTKRIKKTFNKLA